MTTCNQTKCAFNQIGVGCQKCETCGAEPYIIDDNCDTCWNCQGDEGILRWDNESDEQEEKEIEIKPMEIEAK